MRYKTSALAVVSVSKRLTFAFSSTRFFRAYT